MTSSELLDSLRLVIAELSTRGRGHALVGGIAVSVRAEVRFTRDVDLAVQVRDDPEAEVLVRDLGLRGYVPIATVEHEATQRLSTVRLKASTGMKIDLLFASCGIEREVVARATPVELPEVGFVPVAEPEELLAMKVLSMSERRLQDRLDAQRLVTRNPGLDIERVRDNLRLITERGYNRQRDLAKALTALLAEL
ncbi:MAG: nucleotidyl transferase AbiEii/AbiGii toxin family protein [Proteobacteria bacterium]|nr:nucleotidyl transferase AbiEii/AbiGii toxin family protein [Pseudomonadota bacterium]